jgi:isopenicillin N synthase-like dioxygenase
MHCPSTNSQVQIVDLGPFLDGSDKPSVAAAILESFKSIGFVYLINHGLSEDKIASMFECSKKMFAQPLEIKQLAPHPESGAHHRGYSAPGREKVIHLADDDNSRNLAGTIRSDVQRDIKESYEVGREDNDEMPNIWFPDGVVPGFKENCLDFYWTCYETEKVILKALALGFNLSEDFFLPYHSKADNQLRLLHYPSIPAKILEDKNASRIPSHTDFCSLTMLIQDNIGGLEVEDPNQPGVFIPVPPVPGSIVVNAGDFLMRWSNDTIKSTVHRVRTPLSVDGNNDAMIPSRYSIPYFCGADLNTVVDCIPGTWSAERPKRYSPISAREYVLERLAANY